MKTINIPLSHIIDKIKEEKGLSDAEINAKIEAKLGQLSGLISKEGAAHIIANELGVKVIEMGGKLKIQNILAGMRSVETVGKVTRVFEVRDFKSGEREGKVGSFIIGDETGTIRVVCWGSQTDKIREISEGSIVQIQNGYVRENNNFKEIHMNDRARIILNPAGQSIGEVKTTETKTRKKINELGDSDQNIELLGTIVQSMDPRFYEVCPQCNKRLKQTEAGLACDVHNVVEPKFAYVFNVVLDDGTDSIRLVCFKNQAENLLGKSEVDILQLKDRPELFEQMKNDLLGLMVKVVGRVSRNEMFDRKEFVTQLVFRDPNPEEEINNLQSNI
ncbi:OB-fold nucleic acid binding domain-containing protein [Nanoarchaeota archaeon]